MRTAESRTNNLIMKRILSALVLIPLVILLVQYAPAPVFALALALLTGLALGEFYAIARKSGAACQQVWGIAVGVAVVATVARDWMRPEEILLAGTLISGCLCLFSEKPLEQLARGWVFTVFGWIYIAVPISLLYSLRYGDYRQSGAKLIFFLLVLQWLQDTAAYFVGSAWGRHKVAPLISPKKSVEGSIAGLLAAVAGGTAFHFLVFDSTRLPQILLLSLALGIIGQMSDIAESLFKRAAAVKDSSQLIPGHGGVLDRIDGLLFATPAFWLLLRHWPI
jgi:phosphatidate cytidylyltransferase